MSYLTRAQLQDRITELEKALDAANEFLVDTHKAVMSGNTDLALLTAALGSAETIRVLLNKPSLLKKET